MVDGISSYNNNNKQPKCFDAITKPNIDARPIKRKPIPRDEVIINKQNAENSTSTLQKASSIAGLLASSVFVIYLLKNLAPFGKYKNIQKFITKNDMPDFVKQKLAIELDKLKKSFMDTDGVQNYISNVARLDWSKSQNKIVDTKKAQKILDENHVGLRNVKQEIIKYLNVQNYNLKNNITNKPLILCLDGPPGVGKTTIAESIAEAMDKPFERISLAGVSHKSFIAGSERLYKGAEPGHIIKAIQNSGVSNPVILLDEIDKMGKSVEHGDPSAALLDILESKQCKNFKDDYLELPYDLSNVTFIITSNDISKIPEVLRDRLSIINIPAYGKQEKLDICKHTITKMLAESKLNPSLINFSREGINEIVDQTSDKGARGIVRNLESIFDEIKKISEKKGIKKQIIINKKFVSKFLKKEPTKNPIGFKLPSDKKIENEDYITYTAPPSNCDAIKGLNKKENNEIENIISDANEPIEVDKPPKIITGFVGNSERNR